MLLFAKQTLRCALLYAVAHAAPAAAQEMPGKLFGNDFRIERVDYEGRLLIGDREILRSPQLLLDEIAVVDGTPVLIGSASSGGNMCDAAPFVVSFPSGGKPRLDGPLETCASVQYESRLLRVAQAAE